MWIGSSQIFDPRAGSGSVQSELLEDRWILSRFNRVTKDVNEALDAYRFHEAANRIYDFFWGDFCDWYIELIKPRLNAERPPAKSQRALPVAT